MKIWTDVFKLPLKLDAYGEQYVFDANNQMVFMFDDDVKNPKQLFNKIVTEEVPNFLYDKGYTYTSSGGGYIMKDEKYIISIRGWGYLTGVGGLNLPDSEAIWIQDSLGQYIVNKLNL